MKNLKQINNISYISIIISSIIFYSFSISSNENKIIFKINNKAYTSLDYIKRIKYLDFVGSNSNLDNKIILDDFISANLFYEYHINSNKNKATNFDDKIYEIFENIKNTNILNNKNYNYELEKDNIIFNIKIDYVRKNILEGLINSNLDNIKLTENEIDLLYSFKIQYVNFKNNQASEIINEISKTNQINIENITNILNKNKINFFIKEKQIENIENIDKRILKAILNNKNFIIINSRNDDVSIILIEKYFETLNGIVANIFSVRSKNEIDNEFLNCKNLLENKDNLKISNKEYKFQNLNNKLKENLININDYVKYTNNEEIIYVILCDIKFNKEILNNIKLNKLINLNVDNIEKKFVSKYSKIYNLIKSND